MNAALVKTVATATHRLLCLVLVIIGDNGGNPFDPQHVDDSRGGRGAGERREFNYVRACVFEDKYSILRIEKTLKT